MTTPLRERPATPGAAELLRAALEKIVFFEWRLSELASELAGAQSRTAAAEAERQRAHEQILKATLEAQEARRRTVDLEAERARLASLLAHPAQASVPIEEAALFAERDRTAALSAELEDARRELARQKDERARWLQQMIEQARQGDEAPAALAQFISELRSEVIELRDRQKRCDSLLAQAGIALPEPALPLHASTPPVHEHDAISQARKLWAEGRLGEVHASPRAAVDPAASSPLTSPPTKADADVLLPARSAPPTPAGTDLLPGLATLHRSPATTSQIASPALPARPIPAAQRALVEQCLRGLTAGDAARRAQAARHLASLPLPAAAPGLAAALGRETDPRAKAAIARALAACGGEGAAALISQLQTASEPALVRLAALDALTGMEGPHARAALEIAIFDEAPALRRRAAALVHSSGEHPDLLARLSIDSDSTVRAAAGGEGSVPEAPLVEEELRGRSERAPISPVHAATTMIDLPTRSAIASRNTTSPDRVGPLPARPAAFAPKLESADSKLTQDAVFAVRTAILGLTESDIAEALGLELPRAESLVQQLIARGLLARRGRRLIVGAAVESVNAERGA